MKKTILTLMILLSANLMAQGAKEIYALGGQHYQILKKYLPISDEALKAKLADSGKTKAEAERALIKQASESDLSETGGGCTQRVD